MKKILYFLNVPTDLQIAKNLQEEGFEIYGITDVSELLQKTFEEQEIIKFEKIWNFQRELKIENKQKIDIDYLTYFEEKYNITLMSLVFKDRNMYQYNEYHKFKFDEILLVIIKTAKFFEKIINEIKPDYVWVHTPDYFHYELFYELCKVHQIRILTLSHARPFQNRYIISETTDKIDNSDTIFNSDFDGELKSFEELQKIVENNFSFISPKKHDIMLSKTTKIRGFLHYFSRIDEEYGKYYVNYGRSRLSIFKNETLKILKTFVRKQFIGKKFKKNVDLEKPFVYFPLHFQPERSTLSVAPFYTNQIEIIRHIAKSLPINFRLIVKEHPLQEIAGWRNISYYKEIFDIPNVELLNPKFSNDLLLEKTSLIVAITGTIACTAAFFEKPSIVFGNAIFNSLPSIFRIHNIEDLPSIIKKAINSKVEIYDVNKFVKIMIDNSFELDFYGIMVPMAKKFFFDGLTTDVYIKKSDLEDFLIDVKPSLKIWSDELIKKMNQN